MAKATTNNTITPDSTGTTSALAVAPTDDASTGTSGEKAAASTVATVKYAHSKTPDTGETEDMDTEGEPASPASPTLNAAPEGGTLSLFHEQGQPIPVHGVNTHPLSIKEMEELKTHENVIRAGLPTFLAVGRALQAINRKKLFRIYAATMAEYCDKYLGISRVYAHMQASAAQVMDNLLTSGEQIVLPTTERQLRPLVRLKTVQEQVAAWKRAQVLAGEKEKISGADVDKAVKELLGNGVQKENWVTKCTRKFAEAGYETGFDQPVNVGDEWIDLLDPESDTYIKLIDVPVSLSSLGICLALRDQEIKCQVVVNGDHIEKKRLVPDQAGIPTKLADPVLGVLIKSLDALVVYRGAIYQGGELDDDSLLELVRAESDEAKALEAALATEGTAVV